VAPGDVVTFLDDAAVPFRPVPSYALVARAARTPGRVVTTPGFHYTAVDVGAGLVLVMAESTAPIDRETQRLTKGVVLAALLSALGGVLLTQWAFRRSRRDLGDLVTYARRVADGDVDGSRVVAPGSSDLRLLGETLTTMVDELREQADREHRQAAVMQQLLGDVSHELRTPLTVIKGYRELLATQGLDDTVRARALERIEGEVSRMEQLVADLLTSAELRERPVTDAAATEIADLVRQRVTEWSEENPSHRVTVTAPDTCCVWARPDLIERLLRNALSNVVRYTPEDSLVHVRLTIDGTRATLVVEDNGPGLDEYGEAPRRFWRGEGSRSRDTGGSGLGMSIMADIAASLGGSFRTERSALGGLAVVVALRAC
jgi:two-component system OmpR family sensor kinase